MTLSFTLPRSSDRYINIYIHIYIYIYIYIYEVKLLIAYELDSQNSLERGIIKVNVFITSGKQKVSLDNLKLLEENN